MQQRRRGDTTWRVADKILLKSVGERLHEHVRKSDMTLKALADALGLRNHTQLSNYLSGARIMPLDIFINMCAILGVDPSGVLAYSDEDYVALMKDVERVRLEAAKLYEEAAREADPAKRLELVSEAVRRDRRASLFERRLKLFSAAKQKRE